MGERNTLPSIVIVGRPNVGKSSLFNAILKRRQAIVHFDSGVTRDRVSAIGLCNGRRFNLVDTGGLGMYSGEKRGVGFWDQSIERQVETAIAEADLILFTVDASAGLTPLDAEIATRLRATGKPISLVVNKIDNCGDNEGPEEFHKLGFGKIYPVSCLHRKGITSLQEGFLSGFARNASGTESVQRLKIAVIGRPNAGKSSLVNKMLGEDRVIVSDIAGTTRDSIDVDFTLRCGEEEVPATIIDTAGLRKKSKVDSAVELFSMMRASEAIERADIVLFLVTSAQFGATSQDKTIAKMIGDAGKPCIIVANKWDTCESELKQQDVLKEIRYTLPKLEYAPVVFTCALTGFHFRLLYQAIAEIRAQMSIKISTAMVNRVLGDACDRYAAPVVNGTKAFKIYYGTMVKMPPPTFSLFVNDPKYLADNYKVYLENYLRKAFGFTGMPIRLEFKARERRELVFIEHKETVKKAGTKKGLRRKAGKTTVYLKPDSKKRGVKKDHPAPGKKRR